MKRAAVLVLALGVAAAGCNKKSTTPTTPTGSSTFQTQFIFNTTILPSNEIPPVANAESVGRGVVGITVNVTRDGNGAITAGKVDYHITLTGFPATTNFTAAHIHEGNAATNGPVRVQTGLANSEIQLVAGGAQILKANIDIGAAFAQAIIDNPSGWYFNIHTTANGGGVARGQLVRVQ